MYICNGVNTEFFNHLFHFHRYLTLYEGVLWKRMFWFDGKNNVVKDEEFQNIVRTLIHHELININYSITQKGIQLIEEDTLLDSDFMLLMTNFLNQYKGETFQEKTCYVPNEIFPASCHLCLDRVCVKSEITKQDILNVIRFKGFKKPYKKITYKNPLLLK